MNMNPVLAGEYFETQNGIRKVVRDLKRDAKKIPDPSIRSYLERTAEELENLLR